MVSDPKAKTSTPFHAVLAVVLQVRDGRLQVLLWERALDPFRGSWSLPGGTLAEGETLEQSIRRHLATKVDVRDLSHLEQLETLQRARPPPGALGAGHRVPRPRPERRRSRASPTTRSWFPVDELPQLAFDHGPIVLAGRERLRAKLSYTNAGFALAPDEFTISELRDLYRAALGHDVSATNLQRVLLRRHLLVPTGSRREPGPAGGRPAALFGFANRELEITDQFAVLRPPGSG